MYLPMYIFQEHMVYIIYLKYLIFTLTDTTLTNDLNASHVVSPLPQPLSLGQVQQGDDEGLLQLEPPITSSEYSFSLDEQENLHDLFDSLPFSL